MKPNKLLAKLVINLMLFIRPTLGLIGCCKYQISCTRYAKLALHRYSWHKASWLIITRVLSCW